MKTKIEQQLLKFISLKKVRLITTGDLVTSLSFSKEQEEELLKRSSRKGLLIRLKRGLYLAPEKPIFGRWNPSEYYLLYYFMKYESIPYQVCGPTLFNKYGFENQLSDITFVYNTKFSKEKQIGSKRFSFIKVNEIKLGGYIPFTTGDGLLINESSKERTLVDAFNEYKRFNTLPRTLEWFRKYLSDTENIDFLTEMIVRYGSISTKRRCGFLFNKLNIDFKCLNKIKESIGNGKSVIPLIPDIKASGKVYDTWGIIDNE